MQTPSEGKRYILAQLNKMIDYAIFENWHNVIVLWGELGKGKTSHMMQLVHRVITPIYKDEEKAWRAVVSFELEPHTCLKGDCGHSWDAGEPFKFMRGCPKCGKESETTDRDEALRAVYKKWFVDPFPYDYDTGLPKKFPEGQKFIINTSRAYGSIKQIYPYMNFSFDEIRNTLKRQVDLRIRLAIAGWDDIAVYFHKSNIQYMHPYVKNFFSRYNFIRKYLANLIITVPDPSFVPEQLMLFSTGDVQELERGRGDFDVKKKRRSFWGKQLVYTKQIDGRNVTWEPVPPVWFEAYEEIRHAHAVLAFEKPEEVMVTTMPKKGKEFTEEDSLFG